MESRDLLTDVSIYLRVTLANEKLSEHAELCRKQLLQKLYFKESSPQAYLDMNVSTKGDLIKPNKTNLIVSECYELLSDANAAKEKEASETKSSDNTYPITENSYYNVPALLTQSLFNDESKPGILTQPSNNNKQSLLSQLKNNKKNSDTKTVKKDNSDRISESSSVTYSCSSKSDEIGEVLTISASALRYSAVKYGSLSRKERFLFMELSKQYWAALLGHTLYMYGNEKDNKPAFEVDITGYQARPAVLRESNKKDFIFEVFAPGNKTYQLIAESSTEMEQWISAICLTGKVNDMYLKSEIELSLQKETVRQLPSIPLAQMLYDQPDSVVRPVLPPQHQVYELMQEPADDLYHYIEHKPKNENVSTENENAMYKNANVSLNGCEEDDNMYYNLIPCADNEDCIYDVISEKTEEMSSKAPKRISQIIDKPKTECSVKNLRPNELIIQDEIYELVN